MKKLIPLAMALLISGCSVWYYGSNYGNVSLRNKYPECQQYTSQGDFVNCVHEIELKEGKLR